MTDAVKTIKLINYKIIGSITFSSIIKLRPCDHFSISFITIFKLYVVVEILRQLQGGAHLF